MEIFNFGEEVKNWVRSLQINSTSKILQNGHLSDEIALGRGCRQGDPISPYLFVLAAEFLAEAIRSYTNIKGLTILEKEHKLSLYADDTTLFIKYEEECIRSCMGTLREFKKILGLRVNTEKTKCIKIGVTGDNMMNLCTDLNLIWTHKFTSLGITYNVHEMDNITDRNIEQKEKEIFKLINTWKGRNITPIGKITIIKSLLISKITHIMLSLPTTNERTMMNLDTVFRNFLWNDKPPSFNKKILENTCSLEGLKMTNLKTFDQALKISWLKRLKNGNDGWEEVPMYHNVHRIVMYGDNYIPHLLKKITNPFWKNVIESCGALQNRLTLFNIKPYNIPLWYNSRININYKKDWLNKGYVKVADILNTDGNIFTFNEILERGLGINFLEYETLRFDISRLNVREDYNRIFGPYLPIYISHDRL